LDCSGVIIHIKVIGPSISVKVGEEYTSTWTNATGNRVSTIYWYPIRGCPAPTIEVGNESAAGLINPKIIVLAC